MKNVHLINFRDIKDPERAQFFGHLTPLECGKEIPFDIKRVYYISGVDPQARRGFHSHKELEQVLIALSGPVKILVKTPFEEETVLLDKPWQGLYIGPMVWREMFDFSEHTTLLVLASRHYDENDYIRQYADYEKLALPYFENMKKMEL